MHTITKDVNGKVKKTSASNAEDVCTDLPCTTSLLDFKLRRAQLLAFQDFSESLSQLKIRPAEFSVLAMIAQHPGQKQTTIAEMLGIKRANFVFLMDSIESRGLAVRRKEKNDRRSHSLYLTDEGIRFVKKMTSLWQEHEKRLVAKLGGRDNLNRLIDLLDRFLAADNDGKPARLAANSK